MLWALLERADRPGMFARNLIAAAGTSLPGGQSPWPYLRNAAEVLYKTAAPWELLNLRSTIPIERRAYVGDLLERAGVGKLGSVHMPLLGEVTGRGTIGLLGDILTDPLTPLALGGAAGVKAGQKALSKAGREVLSEVAEAGTRQASRRYVHAWGQRAATELAEQLAAREGIKRGGDLAALLSAARVHADRIAREAAERVGATMSRGIPSLAADAVTTAPAHLAPHVDEISRVLSEAIPATATQAGRTLAERSLAQLLHAGDALDPVAKRIQAQALGLHSSPALTAARGQAIARRGLSLADMIDEGRLYWHLPFMARRELIRNPKVAKAVFYGVNPFSAAFAGTKAAVRAVARPLRRLPTTDRALARITETASRIRKGAGDTLGPLFDRDYATRSLPEHIGEPYRRLQQHWLDAHARASADISTTVGRIFKGTSADERLAIARKLDRYSDAERGLIPDPVAALVGSGTIDQARADHLHSITRDADQLFTRIGEQEKRLGILNATRRDYITHIIEKGDKAKFRALMQRYAAELPTTHGYAEPRFYSTFDELEAAGMTPKLDAAEIMAIRLSAHHRAVTNAKFLQELQRLGLAQPLSREVVQTVERTVTAPPVERIRTILADYPQPEPGPERSVQGGVLIKDAAHRGRGPKEVHLQQALERTEAALAALPKEAAEVGSEAELHIAALWQTTKESEAQLQAFVKGPAGKFTSAGPKASPQAYATGSDEWGSVPGVFKAKGSKARAGHSIDTAATAHGFDSLDDFADHLRSLVKHREINRGRRARLRDVRDYVARSAGDIADEPPEEVIDAAVDALRYSTGRLPFRRADEITLARQVWDADEPAARRLGSQLEQAIRTRFAKENPGKAMTKDWALDALAGAFEAPRHLSVDMDTHLRAWADDLVETHNTSTARRAAGAQGPEDIAGQVHEAFLRQTESRGALAEQYGYNALAEHLPPHHGRRWAVVREVRYAQWKQGAKRISASHASPADAFAAAKAQRTQGPMYVLEFTGDAKPANVAGVWTVRYERKSRGYDIRRSRLPEAATEAAEPTAAAAPLAKHAPPPAAPAPGPKEPWAMTGQEWQRAMDDAGMPTQAKITPSDHGARVGERERLRYGARHPYDPDLGRDPPVVHRDVVEKALAEGKPVPPDVLKDYPDLAPAKAGPASPEATTGAPAHLAEAQRLYPSLEGDELRRSADALAEIERISALGRERMAAADPSIRGLHPAAVDWLDDAEREAFQQAKDSLPKHWERRRSAVERLIAKGRPVTVQAIEDTGATVPPGWTRQGERYVPPTTPPPSAGPTRAKQLAQAVGPPDQTPPRAPGDFSPDELRAMERSRSLIVEAGRDPELLARRLQTRKGAQEQALERLERQRLAATTREAATPAAPDQLERIDKLRRSIHLTEQTPEGATKKHAMRQSELKHLAALVSGGETDLKKLTIDEAEAIEALLHPEEHVRRSQVKTRVPNADLPDDWVPVPVRGPGWEGLMVPYEIAKSIRENVLREADWTKSHPEALPFLRGIDKITNWWKASVTSPFPAFHARNAFSNVILSMSDIGLRQFNPKVKLAIRRAMTGAPGTFTTKDGRRFTFRQLRETMTARKVVADQFRRGELIRDVTGQLRTITARTTERAFAFWNPDVWAPFTLGRKFGAWVENRARVSLFLSNLDRGLSIDDAVAHVNRFLFDYGNLSPFERNVMHRAIPFYTWMSKNARLQLSLLWRQPRVMATLAHLGFKLRGDPKRLALPSYMQQGLALEVGTDKQGDPLVLSGLGIPQEDFNKLWSRQGFRDTLALLGSQANPLVSKTAELTFGKHLFYGSDIAEYRRAYPVIGQLPKWVQDWMGYRSETAPNGKTYHYADPWRLWWLSAFAGRLYATAGKATDPAAPRMQRALNALSGMKVHAVPQERTRRWIERRRVAAVLEQYERVGKVRRLPIAYVRKQSVTPDEAALLHDLLAYSKAHFGRRRKARSPLLPAPIAPGPR